MSGATARDVVQAGSVTGGIHFHQPAQHRHAPPRQLRADVPGFVNRTGELAWLDEVFDGSPAPVLVVAGMAGAGKTSLALRWAHRVKDRFPDGQLFVNLRGYDPGEPVAAAQALRTSVRALGVPADDVPSDPEAVAGLYRSLLAGRRVLVVLDNAASVGQVRPMLPGGEGSLVLVTSRSRLSGLAVRDGARRVTLGVLPEPEAVALLRSVTAPHRSADETAELAQLAQLCARLPLALRIAAERAASRPYMALGELIADLRDGSALWDALSTGGEEEAEAVRTVFTWSYRALPAPAARLFRLLGLYPGSEFAPHVAAALADIPLGRARQVLDDLVGAHLLEQTGTDRFQFHDLLRAYAAGQALREEPAEERRAAVLRMLSWYLHTADAAQCLLGPAEPRLGPEVPSTGVPLPAFADYDAAVDWAEQEADNVLPLLDAAVSAGHDRLAWQLAAALWHALLPAAPESRRLRLAHTGLAAAERDGDRRAQIRFLTDIGKAYRALNRFDDGLTHLDRALALARGTADRPAQARTLNLIGLIHLRTRRLEAAARHFSQAVTVFRELGDRRAAANLLSNLASTHMSAGELEPAGTAVEAALAAHRALGNARGEGNALRLAAALHLERGEIAEAAVASEAALDAAHALRDRSLLGFWLLTWGDVQRAQGRYDVALEAYERSAALHRQAGDRSREALAWRGAGRTYTATGRTGEAIGLHRRAATVHEELGDAWELAVECELLAAGLDDEDPDEATVLRARALACLEPYADPRAGRLRARITAGPAAGEA